MDLRGSRCKASRGLGRKVDQKVSDKDPLTRRGAIKRRQKKKSDYGLHLIEVQVARMLYGIFERQFRNYFKKAKAKVGNTAEELVVMLERRFDNAVYRAGITTTRRQAKQLVVHRHFWINGRPVDRPSYQLRPGDVFEVKPTKVVKPFYKDLAEDLPHLREGHWLKRVGNEGFKFAVDRMPLAAEAEQDFDAAFIVEYYSKFV